MSERIDLQVIVDKHGRTFETGKGLFGHKGVTVEHIGRIGNFVQVDFARAGGKPPPAMVFHVGDLERFD
jgi:hypothetical protein